RLLRPGDRHGPGLIPVIPARRAGGDAAGMAHLSTKTYGAERGLSCALRQWRAQSHCALVHGYSLGFRFTFAAEQLDPAGWVVDFGKAGFGPIREWLHANFDHTLLVAEDDPARESLMALGAAGLANPKLVPGTS